MLIIISSILVSLSILLAAFVNFSPNLKGVVEEDFRRRVISSANLYALQYGQLCLRAKTIKEDEAVTFPPRQDCPLGVCGEPSATDGEYLNRENSADKNWVYSVISYGKLVVTDPAPTLTVTSSLKSK